MNARWFFWRSWLFFSVISLAACSASTNLDYPRPRSTVTKGATGAVSGAVAGGLTGNQAAPGVGAIVGGAVGSMIGDHMDRNRTVEEQLEFQGVKIIRVGDSVKIVMPSDKIFFANTPRLNPHFDPILQRVAWVIKKCPKTNIKVAVFSDNVGQCAPKLALTRAQAQTLSDYLWEQGIDARLIYAVGFGSNHPIAYNKTSTGQALNRRIEITYWTIPKDDEFL